MTGRKPPKAGKRTLDAQLTVVSNGVRREIVSADMLSPEMRKEVDFLSDDDSVIVYKGYPTPLENFMYLDPSGGPLGGDGWHGAASDSFFSGLVIWLDDDGESCIVGRYYS